MLQRNEQGPAQGCHGRPIALPHPATQVGSATHLFDLVGILQAEVCGQLVQDSQGITLQFRHLRDLRDGCEVLQPAALHQHAQADQAILAENVAEALDPISIAPAARCEGTDASAFAHAVL